MTTATLHAAPSRASSRKTQTPQRPQPYRFSNEIMACYVLLCSGAAWLWFAGVGILNTLSGSLTCAMLLLGVMVNARRSRGLVESIRYGAIHVASVCLVVGLYLWRQENLPADFERTQGQMIIGPWAFLAFMAVINVTAIWLLKLQKSETDKPKSEYDTSYTGPAPCQTWHIAAAALGVVLACASLITLWLPQVISSAPTAITRFALNTIMDFEGQNDVKGLNYYLMGQRTFDVGNVRQEGNLLKAQIKVLTPVVPFELESKDFSSHEALREFIDAKYDALSHGGKSPSNAMPYVQVSAEMTLKRSGLMGWDLASDGGLKDQLEQAQKSYEEGKAKLFVVPQNGIGNNPFGVLELSISAPFSLFISALMMLVAAGLAVRQGGPACAWVLCAGLACAITNYLQLMSFVLF